MSSNLTASAKLSSKYRLYEAFSVFSPQISPHRLLVGRGVSNATAVGAQMLDGVPLSKSILRRPHRTPTPPFFIWVPPAHGYTIICSNDSKIQGTLFNAICWDTRVPRIKYPRSIPNFIFGSQDFARTLLLLKRSECQDHPYLPHTR